MLSYYDKIISLSKAGEILDANDYFEKYKKRKFLSQEEIEELDKLVLDWGALIIQECLADPKATYSLYNTLRRVTGWDDETLSKELNISKRSLENIQSFKIRSRKAIERMVVGLYRFLEII
jgi:hypothetical protein